MNFKKTSLYSLPLLVLFVTASLSGCQKPTTANVDQPGKWDTGSKIWTKAQLVALESGESLYGKYCAACHLKNGQGSMTGGFPPLKGSAIVKGPIKRHISIVLLGKQGTAMPAYANLLNSELAQIITYERNAWGNNTYERNAWGNNTGDWVSDKIIQQQRTISVK